MSDAPDLPTAPAIDEPGQPPYVGASDPPDIPDEYPHPTPGGPGPDARVCHACATAGHSVQTCPDVHALLFAPEVCVECGDPSDAPVCKACMEYAACEQLTADRAIVAGIVRDAWGVPLALRADCLEDSRAIDLVCGF